MMELWEKVKNEGTPVQSAETWDAAKTGLAEADWKQNEADRVANFIEQNITDPEEAEATLGLTDYFSKIYSVPKTDVVKDIPGFIKRYSGDSKPAKTFWRQVWDATKDGWYTDRLGTAGSALMYTEDPDMRRYLEQEIADIRGMMSNPEGNRPREGFTGYATNAVASAGNLMGTMIRPFLTNVAVTSLIPAAKLPYVAARYGTYIPNILAKGAEHAISMGATWTETWRIEAGNIYLDLIDAGVDPIIAKKDAEVHGAIAGFLEAAPFEYAFSKFPFLKTGAQKAFMRLSAKTRTKAGVAKTFGRILKDCAIPVATQTALETATEVLQEVSAIKTEERAMTTPASAIKDEKTRQLFEQDYAAWAEEYDKIVQENKDYLSSKEYSEYVKQRVWETGINTLMGAGLLAGVGGAVNVATDLRQNQREIDQERKRRREELAREKEALKTKPDTEYNQKRGEAVEGELADIDAQEQEDTADSYRQATEQARDEYYENPTEENRQRLDERTQEQDAYEQENNLSPKEREYNDIVGSDLGRNLTEEEIDTMLDRDLDVQAERERAGQTVVSEEPDAPVAETFQQSEKDRFASIIKEKTAGPITDVQAEVLVDMIQPLAKGSRLTVDAAINAYFQQEIARVVTPGETVELGGKKVKIRKDARGAVWFDPKDGKAIILLTQKASFDTWAHEILHVYRRHLTGDMLATLEKHYGVKNGKWTVAAEEQYVKDVLNYFMTRQAPTPELKRIFKVIAEALLNIYRTLSGRNMVSDDIARVFDQMFSDPESAFGGNNYAENNLVHQTTPTPEERAEADRQYNEVVSQYKGTDQWLKAPNGQPTKLTERQWVQVRTPNFKRWFGDWENDPQNASKVVDENGEPRVVYHSYDNSNYNSGLVYSSADKNFSSEFGANTDAVFIRTFNPYITKDDVLRDADGNEIMYDGEPATIGYLDAVSEEYKEWIERNYDGVIDSDGYFIVTFSPEQIKSATDNVGTFSQSNPSILYSLTDERKAERQYREIEKQYKGTDQWMKAPNGEPTELTERQWVQTRTPNFIRWGGDWINDPEHCAVILNDNGEPLVVYHGTSAPGFTKFKRESIGSWFARSRSVAGTYAPVKNDVIFESTITEDWLREKYGITKGYAIYTKNAEVDFEKQKLKGWALANTLDIHGNPVHSIDLELGANIDTKFWNDEASSKEWTPGKDEKIGVAYRDEGRGTIYTSIDALVKDAKKHLEWYQNRQDTGIYPVFIKMQDKAVFDAQRNLFMHVPMWRAWDNEGKVRYFSKINDAKKFAADTGLFEKAEGKTENIVQNAFDNGADGVVFQDIVDEGIFDTHDELSDVFVVKESNQVKSATDNTGLFSDSDDILYQGDEDEYREATENGNYIEDDILEQYRGKEWADDELLAREDYRREAGEYDDYEQFLADMVRIDPSRTDDYYEQIWNTTDTSPDYTKIIPSLTRRMVEKILYTLKRISDDGTKLGWPWGDIVKSYSKEHMISEDSYRALIDKMKAAPEEYMTSIAECFSDQAEFEEMMKALSRHPDLELERIKELERAIRGDQQAAATTMADLEARNRELKEEYRDARRKGKKLEKHAAWLEKRIRNQKLMAMYRYLAGKIFRRPPKMCAIDYVEKIREKQSKYTFSKMLDKTRARLEHELMTTTDPKLKAKIQDRLDRKSLRTMPLAEVEALAEEITALRMEGVDKRMTQLLEIREQRLDQIDRLKRPLGDVEPLDKTGSVESTVDMGHWYEKYIGFWCDMNRITEYLGKEWVDWLRVIKTAFEGEERNVDRRRTALLDKMKSLNITPDTLSKTEEINGKTYTHDIIMSWYIYLQNEDSANALIYGNFKGNPESDAIMAEIENTIDEGLSSLTQAEKDFADWMIESFGGDDWKRVEATVRNVDNASPEQVPRYFMMIRQLDGTQDAQTEPVIDLKDRTSGAGRVSVKKGFTKERIHNINWKHQQPIQLGALPIYMKAIRQQEHYIAFAQLSKDMKYVFAHVSEALTSAHGKSLTTNIGKWIDRVIDPRAYNNFYSDMGALGKIINNSVVAALSYNVLSYLKQFPSVVYFLPYCDGGTLINSFARFIRNWKEITDESKAKSIYLKNRRIDDPITIGQEQLMNPNAKFRGVVKFTQAGMKPFGWVDGWACTIGWNAVYTYAMEHGATEEEAVNRANDALLKTQPQAYSMYSPTVYTKPIWRTMLLFSRQINQINQMLTADIWRPDQDLTGVEKTQYVMRMIFCVAFGALIMGWAGRKFGGYGDNDKPWYLDLAQDVTANTVTNLQPFVGPALANTIQRKMYTSGGYVDPISQYTSVMTKFLQQPVKQDELNYDDAIRMFTEAMGAAGLPKVATWRAYKALKESDAWYLFIGSPLGGKNGGK